MLVMKDGKLTQQYSSECPCAECWDEGKRRADEATEKSYRKLRDDAALLAKSRDPGFGKGHFSALENLSRVNR